MIGPGGDGLGRMALPVNAVLAMPHLRSVKRKEVCVAFNFIAEASSSCALAFVDAAECGCDAVNSFRIRHIPESFGGQHPSVAWELV
jgi:hypothetical protein